MQTREEKMLQKSLHLPHDKMVGTNWTSVEEIQGWNHFVVVTLQKREGVWNFELMAACDKQVRFWISKSALKNAAHWRPGWLRGVCESS